MSHIACFRPTGLCRRNDKGDATDVKWQHGLSTVLFWTRAFLLWEESRLESPKLVFSTVLSVPTPFWSILAVSILLLIPLP